MAQIQNQYGILYKNATWLKQEGIKEDGKWIKPENWEPPDNLINAEIAWSARTIKEKEDST